MSYPIKPELVRAHGLLCKAAALLVMQIVLSRYRAPETREAHEKVREAAKTLQNLIAGAAPLV